MRTRFCVRAWLCPGPLRLDSQHLYLTITSVLGFRIPAHHPGVFSRVCAHLLSCNQWGDWLRWTRPAAHQNAQDSNPDLHWRHHHWLGHVRTDLFRGCRSIFAEISNGRVQMPSGRSQEFISHQPQSNSFRPDNSWSFVVSCCFGKGRPQLVRYKVIFHDF